MSMPERSFIKSENIEKSAGIIAEKLFEFIKEAIKNQENETHIALTGGGLGIKLLEKLGEKFTVPSEKKLSNIHFWWGDERYLDINSKDRNDTQAFEVLLKQEIFKTANIHRVIDAKKGFSLEYAAKEYDEQIKNSNLNNSEFDLVILGVGPDGHIASIFPGHTDLKNISDNVLAVYNSPKPPAERVSLSYKRINNSKNLWLLASGKEKEVIVEKLLSKNNINDSSLPCEKVNAKQEIIVFH